MGKRAKNKSHLEVQSKNPLNEKLIVLSFIFFVTITFFFPALQGKIECPIDIRDFHFYPWKYHSTDIHVVKSDLVKLSIAQDLTKESNQYYSPKVFKVPLKPGEQKELEFKININDIENKTVSDQFNYYIYYEFLPILEKNDNLNFAVYVKNSKNKFAKLPFSAFPLEGKENYTNSNSKWLFAKVNLNFVLDELKSFNGLRECKLVLVVLNNNKNISTLFISNPKITTEDFSAINKKAIHSFYTEDLIIWFTSAREFFSNSIKSGKIPFWNNYILTGAEFISEPQVGYFNPIYFLSYLMFDHFTAHLVVLILFFLISGVGSYLLARSWGLNIPSGLLTSLVYLFNPYLVPWFGYEHTLMCNAVIPYLILFYDKTLNNKKLLNNDLIFSTIIYGILVLSGHLQVIYYSIFFFILYAIFRLLIDPQNMKLKILKHIFNICFINLLGLSIGGIVLFQFFPLLSDSHRLPMTVQQLRDNCTDLSALKSFLYPYYRGVISFLITDRYSLDPVFMDYKVKFFKNYLYFGALPFLFSIFSLKNLLKDRLVLFLVIAILFAFLNSSSADFYLTIRNIIPGFNLLQNSRFIEIYSYCIPFLAGIGFNNFSKHFTEMDYKKKFCITALILLITTIDLVHYSSFFITWSDRKDYKPIHKGGVLEYLINEKVKSSEPFRVLCVENPYNIAFGLKPTSAKSNNLLPYGIEEVHGYSSFIPKDLYWLLMYPIIKDQKLLYGKHNPEIGNNRNLIFPSPEYKSRIYDILNAKYFLTSPDFSLDPDRAIKVFDGDSRLWLNKNYLPRAFLVPSYKIISTKPEIIVTLDNEDFDPLKEVLIQSIDNKTKVILDNLKSKELSLESQIKFAKYENENIILNVKTNSGGILVLGNNLNNEWMVKVNNTPADFFKVNLVQTGILLPSEGEYEVEYYFYPKKFYIGLFITGLTLIVLILMLVMLKVKARKE